VTESTVLILNDENQALQVERYVNCAELPQDVRDAMQKAETHSIEQGHDWYLNLVNTVFHGDAGIRIFVLSVPNEILAVLPIRIVPVQGRETIEALANYYTSLYQPYISERATSARLAVLLRAILNDCPNAYKLTLAPLNTQCVGYGRLREAMSSAGLVPFTYFCFGNWYLKANKTWSDYLETRPSQLRNIITRKAKSFRRMNGVLELIQTSDRLEYGIQAYQEVYGTSWKVQEPYPDFMPGLIRMLEKSGWLRLGVATLNGKPVATQVWIVAYGRACIYKLAYDESSKNLSAGSLLSAMLMEHVLDQDKVNEVDYLTGDDTYKAAWMSDRRERWGLVAYNLKTARGVFGAGWEAVWHLLKPWFSKLREPKAVHGAGDG
jgi:hypothetical protein